MLILIFELSKLPSPLSFQKRTLHRRRFFRPSYLSIQPSLAIGLYRQESFTSAMFLAPASACDLIGNDHKSFSFCSICYRGFVVKLYLLPSSKTQSVSRFFIENFIFCYLPMAITIARFIGMRHANIHWKSEEDVYAFSIQSFLSFHFESWSKNLK
jgi:hypothetical protein